MDDAGNPEEAPAAIVRRRGVVAVVSRCNRLLVIRRSSQVVGPGAVCFPGGGIEASDDNVLGAALRETEEEIGLAPSFVQPLGFLPDQIVLTGFRITPVVALVRAGFQLRVDSAEVAEVFEIPLEYLTQADNYRPTRRVLRG